MLQGWKRSGPAVTQSLCTTSGYLEFEMDDVPALNRPLLACQKVQRLPKMMKNEYQVQYIILVCVAIQLSLVEN